MVANSKTYVENHEPSNVFCIKWVTAHGKTHADPNVMSCGFAEESATWGNTNTPGKINAIHASKDLFPMANDCPGDTAIPANPNDIILAEELLA